MYARLEWWDRVGAHHVERASDERELLRQCSSVQRAGGRISKVDRISKVG